jgi:SAM-dependent methyltransferase
MINFSYINGNNLNILDFGCGYGVNTIKLLKSGHRLTSVDINPDWGPFIIKNLQRESFDNFKFICLKNDTKHFDFDAKFDVILCTETLEHISDYEQTISLFKKSIKNNGLLIISVPTEFTEKLFLLMDCKWLDESHHLNIFNVKLLIQKIVEQGFTLMSSERKSSEWFIYWFFLKIFRVKQEMGIPVACNKFQQILIKTSNQFIKIIIMLKPVNKICDELFPKSIVLYFKFVGNDT